MTRQSATPPAEPRTAAGRSLWHIVSGLLMAQRSPDGAKPLHPLPAELARDAILAIEAEAAAPAGLDADSVLRTRRLETLLTEALPWIIVPMSDPEDPLGLLQWDGQSKQPNWRMVARRLCERMEADARLLRGKRNE